jgi:hypothetical protein
VYIAAEGSAGIAKRIRAWTQQRKIAQPPDFYLLLGVVPLLQPGASGAFVDIIRQKLGDRNPVSLFWDPLAPMFVGGDENTSRDMTEMCHELKEIRAELGGCDLVVIHHTGHSEDRERGAYALRCEVDTSLKLEADGAGVALEGCKQREEADADRLPLYLNMVKLGDGVTSCTLELGTTPAGTLVGSARQALEALWTTFPPDTGAPSTRWKDATDLAPKTFYRVQRVLVEGGYVSDTKGKRSAPYVVLEKGRHALGVTEP